MGPFTHVMKTGTLLKDLVNDTVCFGLVSAHEEVALDVGFDLLDTLAGVLGEDAVEAVAGREDVFRGDLDVCSLALSTTGRLMDHDLRVRESESLTLLARREEDRSHGSCHSDTDG